MNELKCPDCGAVMHTVREVTDQTVQAGIVQLSRHGAAEHLVPAIEAMLVTSAQLMRQYSFGIEDMKNRLQPVCPGCGVDVHQDSYFYVRRPRRTVLCCSQACVNQIMANHGEG